MALRQLAGPFDIVDREGYAPSGISGQGIYCPNVGLILNIWGSEDTGMAVVAPDGIFEVIHWKGWHALGWWATEHKLLCCQGGIEYIREPKAFIPTEVEGEYEIYQGYWYMRYVRLADRRVYFYSSRVHALLTPTQGVGDNPEGPTFAWSNGLVGPGRNDHEIFVSESTGGGGSTARCCFYDTESQQISSAIMYLGVAAEDLYYAPEYGVLFSYHEESSPDPAQIRVWSLEPLPASISTPALYAGACTKGQTAIYRVRVLGSNSEPCPDELVDWSLGSPPTAGTLLDTQSTTDANGYATARVLYSFTDSGDSTPEATLLC